MSKFKVGDIVVGNAEASERYNITVEGWRGVVTKIIDRRVFEAQGERGIGPNFRLLFDCFDLVQKKHKIIVTTDGKTTTARLFSGKELVKSAEAKCSPRDEFVFETGAALALDRLLGIEKKAEPEAPKFTKADLKTGLFGRMNDGRWFVVLGERLLYGEAVDSGCRGGYDNIERLNADLGFNSGASIDLVVEAVSFFNARDKVRQGKVLWSRPGVKF